MPSEDLERGAHADALTGVARITAVLLRPFRRFRGKPGSQVSEVQDGKGSDGNTEVNDGENQPDNVNHSEDRHREYDKDKHTKAENDEACANIWALYVDEAERYDKRLVESWMSDMDSMLIFSGLYSASLTAFLIESYKNLQPDPADVAVTLLTQISLQLMAASTGAPPQASIQPEPFQATTASLVCNILWFLSLSLGLTCALLATLVKQWARDFVHKTEIRPAPVQRARILSFLYLGLKRFRMHGVVDVIPMLLHASLFFFFAGLVGFLLPVNRILMFIMVGILGAFLALYIIISLLPLIWLDSPYRTPLSGSLWLLWQTLRAPFRIGEIILDDRISATDAMILASHKFSSEVQFRATDAMVSASSKDHRDRDIHAFKWTLTELAYDSELLPFVEAIPGCIRGQHGFRYDNFHLFLPAMYNQKVHQSIGPRITALLSNSHGPSLNEALRDRRQIACLKAIWALCMVSKYRRYDIEASSRAPFTPLCFSPSTLSYIEAGGEIHARLDPKHAMSALAALKYSQFVQTMSYLKRFETLVWDPSTSRETLRHFGVMVCTLPVIPVPYLRKICISVTTSPNEDTIQRFKKNFSGNTPQDWTVHHVHAFAEYMRTALRIGVLPYEFELTSNKFGSEIDKDTKLKRPCQAPIQWLFADQGDPSAANTRSQMADIPFIHDLDRIMGFAMTLFHFLTDVRMIRSSLHGLYHYLADRSRESDTAVAHVLDYCNMRHLLRCIAQNANLRELDPITHHVPLQAITSIFTYILLDVRRGSHRYPICASTAMILLPIFRDAVDQAPSEPLRNLSMLILSWFALRLQVGSPDQGTDADDIDQDHMKPLRDGTVQISRSQIEHIYISSLSKCLNISSSEFPAEHKRAWKVLNRIRDLQEDACRIHSQISSECQSSFAYALLNAIEDSDTIPEVESETHPAELLWKLIPELNWIVDWDAASVIVEAFNVFLDLGVVHRERYWITSTKSKLSSVILDGLRCSTASPPRSGDPVNPEAEMSPVLTQWTTPLFMFSEEINPPVRLPRSPRSVFGFSVAKVRFRVGKSWPVRQFGAIWGRLQRIWND